MIISDINRLRYYFSTFTFFCVHENYMNSFEIIEQKGL